MNKLVVALAAVGVLLPVALAGAAVSATVVVDYDAALGELAEGVAVDKPGNVYTSLAPLGQVRRVDRDGHETLLAQVVPPGVSFGALGLATDASGNVYVAVSSYDPATDTNDPTTGGVYRVARDGSSTRLPGTSAIGFPNGLAFDKRGNLYVTDTARGAVWRVPAGGGPAAVWYESALLAGDGSAAFGFPLGANGIAYRQNELVVGVTEGAKLVRIAVNPDGSSGSATILSENPALFGADGLAIDVHGNVWVAVIAQSTIVKVSPKGTITTVATAADGLDWASSLAFGKNTDLWVVNFAIGPPGGPGPALLRLDAGAKGQPLP